MTNRERVRNTCDLGEVIILNYPCNPWLEKNKLSASQCPLKKKKRPHFLLTSPQILHPDFKIQCLHCLIYFQQLPHLQTIS